MGLVKWCTRSLRVMHKKPARREAGFFVAKNNLLARVRKKEPK